MNEQEFEEYYMSWTDKTRCPICKKKLQRRYEGMVCKNSMCPLYFKLERGWVYLNSEKKRNTNFFKDKYDFNIELFEKKKLMLRKKSEILHKKGRICEICGNEVAIEVHHIIPRSKCPNLSLDIENLMILCNKCHKKIHMEDKYHF